MERNCVCLNNKLEIKIGKRHMLFKCDIFLTEEGADFFIWDDNIAIKPDLPETQTEGGLEKSVDSEGQDSSVSIVDITESINYIESNKVVLVHPRSAKR